MHIFIDESGTFVFRQDRGPNISAVGALVIPSAEMKGFERLYNRYRKSLPLSKGEVKGRELSESQVSGVCDILRKVGAIFEISVIDLDEADQYQIDEHRKIQAGNLTSNLTDKHKKSLIEDVERTKRQLENMPIQLYIQSVLIGHLIYVTLKNSDLYFVQRLPGSIRLTYQTPTWHQDDRQASAY